MTEHGWGPAIPEPRYRRAVAGKVNPARRSRAYLDRSIQDLPAVVRQPHGRSGTTHQPSSVPSRPR